MNQTNRTPPESPSQWQELGARLHYAWWWVRWKMRGHARNHDAAFCPHSTKVLQWRMEDGCTGSVCDWCHLFEAWCPTEFPDVVERVRIHPDGSRNQD